MALLLAVVRAAEKLADAHVVCLRRGAWKRRSPACARNTPIITPHKSQDLHVERGGKMVPFAGYELPVQYAGAGVLKEHMHCRAPGKASVFDVGHMGQIKWTGADRAAFLEKCVVGDIKGLGAGEGRLSLLTNESGGIVR